MGKLAAFNFKQWIEEHRHLLKPPVGNKCVWEDSEFIVMVIGGPNKRKDYHVDKSEEFFYQLEGDISLKVIEDGKFGEIPIGEGEIFLLPANIPHSPQRPENTVGLVIERKRHEGELDGFEWYCEQCQNKLHEEYLQLTNIVTQLPPIFEKFYQNEEHHTCKKCGSKLLPS